MHSLGTSILEYMCTRACMYVRVCVRACVCVCVCVRVRTEKTKEEQKRRHIHRQTDTEIRETDVEAKTVLATGQLADISSSTVTQQVLSLIHI